MTNETQTNNTEVLFYYYGVDGAKYYTPNVNLAVSRANAHGTEDVYMEKNNAKSLVN